MTIRILQVFVNMYLCDEAVGRWCISSRSRNISLDSSANLKMFDVEEPIRKREKICNVKNLNKNCLNYLSYKNTFIYTVYVQILTKGTNNNK